MLVIVVAVKAEADALICHFKLKYTKWAKGVSVYSNNAVVLGICGVGFNNAHGYTKALMTTLATRKITVSGWVNFGIAGCADVKVGELIQGRSVGCIAHNVHANLRVNCNIALPLLAIETVLNPLNRYQSGVVVEMESAGIVSALWARGCLNSLCVIKLITDGPSRPMDVLDKRQIIDTLKKSDEKLMRIFDIICANCS